MILELHNISIGRQIGQLSAMVGDGQMLSVMGASGAGKTTLLRALLGFVAVDGGHICIDGELLTPQSAPYFRRQTAYVPQYLSCPEGCEELADGQWAGMTMDERYLWLLREAVNSGHPLLIVDEPPLLLGAETQQLVDSLLDYAVRQGRTVVAVNDRVGNENVIQL